MPPQTQQQRLQEIANRGLQDRLSDEQRGRFDEAVRRGIINIPGAAEKTPTMGETAVGMGEMALALGTGAVAQPVAGIGGMIEGISEFIRGGDAPESAASRVEELSQSLTFAPRTQAGQQLQRMAGAVIEPIIGAGEEFIGEKVIDPNIELGKGAGSPALAAGTSAAMQFVPALFGLRGVPGRMKERASDVRRVEREAGEVGIDLDQPMSTQAGQVVEEAARQTGGQMARGQDLEIIADAVENAKNISRAEVNRLYDEARATNGGVSVSQARNFEGMAREALGSFDVEAMPIVQRRLNELSEISQLPENAVVRLNAIAKWRQRINRNQPASTDRSQIAALGIIKGQLDEFLDSQFNADMITGNPAAIQKWRTANDAFREFKKTFDENKTIRQLAENQATPEEIRGWVLGASSVGAKREAGATVKRIKNIIGEDSPEFSALRQDVLFDIMEPLLRESPNFRQFTNNYDKFVRNNQTLSKELFPNSTGELSKLNQFARAIERNAPEGIDINLNQTMSRALFGHGIARAALRVNLANQAIGLMRRAVGATDRQRVMSSILGYDPSKAILPISPIVIGAGVQTLREEENGN